MAIKLASISYPVTDLDRARVFYERLFGQVTSHVGLWQIDFLLEGGLQFHLMRDMRQERPEREGILLTWEVPDVGRAVEAAEAAGGKCVLLKDAGEDGAPYKHATVTDPFGNYVALAEAGGTGRLGFLIPVAIRGRAVNGLVHVAGGGYFDTEGRARTERGEARRFLGWTTERH
jgi:predicted enzyme related to lactoylglutathione lyase